MIDSPTFCLRPRKRSLLPVGDLSFFLYIECMTLKRYSTRSSSCMGLSTKQWLSNRSKLLVDENHDYLGSSAFVKVIDKHSSLINPTLDVDS